MGNEHDRFMQNIYEDNTFIYCVRKDIEFMGGLAPALVNVKSKATGEYRNITFYAVVTDRFKPLFEPTNNINDPRNLLSLKERNRMIRRVPGSNCDFVVTIQRDFSDPKSLMEIQVKVLNGQVYPVEDGFDDRLRASMNRAK